MIVKSLKFIISKGGSIKLNIFNIKALREKSLQKNHEKLLLDYPTVESRLDYLSKKFRKSYLKEITLFYSTETRRDKVLDLIAIDSLFLDFSKNGVKYIEGMSDSLPLTEYIAFLELKLLSKYRRKKVVDRLGRRSDKLRIIAWDKRIKVSDLTSPLDKIAKIYGKEIKMVYCPPYSSSLAAGHISIFIEALILVDNILSEGIQEKILDVIKADPDYLTIETLHSLTTHFRNEGDSQDSDTEKIPDNWLLSLKGKRFIDLNFEE